MTDYDVVVYGATMPGVAAVRMACSVDRALSVLLVNPRRDWGGIGCGGGQNFWDRRFWTHGGERRLVQGGSFRKWYDELGQAYDTEEMRERLESAVSGATTLDRWQATDVTVADGGIASVDFTRLELSSRDLPRLGERRRTATADVFVDASESGRLARLAGVPHSIGRAEWAEDDRQMAATQMFRVSGIDWERVRKRTRDGQSVFETRRDPTTNKRLFWGGGPVVDTADSVADFSATHPRFDIKPMNAAEHRDGEFWVNTLLLYDIDGTREPYDPNRPLREDGSRPWCRARARRRARAVIESREFEQAMRSFPGFETATLPAQRSADTIAELLYLRETIHAGDDPHVVTRSDVKDAGVGPDDGADARHHHSRIGLGFYWLDNNGYATDGSDPELGATINPVYLPYEALKVPTCANLLVPGYAANVSGQAWFALRVLPTLCVLGDAAGIAAAVAVGHDTAPTADESFVERLQRELRAKDAVLDKSRAPSFPQRPPMTEEPLTDD